jgi:hypothetical protein
MDLAATQREIDALLKTLSDTKTQSGLESDDPSVIALEQIMLARVSALEDVKATAADSVAPLPLPDVEALPNALIAEDPARAAPSVVAIPPEQA